MRFREEEGERKGKGPRSRRSSLPLPLLHVFQSSSSPLDLTARSRHCSSFWLDVAPADPRWWTLCARHFCSPSLLGRQSSLLLAGF
ncbi:uncharacterized protein DS421_9g282050 [Arachis hypogaea]|nr:uncharacterized protein DS421_9g282050 [Arachis hypogaea]